MYKMTRALYESLRREPGLKVFTEEIGDSSIAWLQFSVKNGGSYKIRFISKDNDNDVAVRIFALVSVETRQYAKVLPVLNMLNAKYRYLKFILDKDGDVNVEYDYLVRCPDPAASAKELIVRMVKIVDEAYPEIMRAMWG